MTSRRKRVAIDARCLFASGIGRYLRGIVSEMATTHGSVEWMCATKSEDRQWLGEFPGVTAHIWEAPIYSVREQGLPLRRLASRSDVLWCPHYPHPLLHTGPLVVTIHDCLHLAHPEWFPGLAKRLFARVQLADAIRRAHTVIAVSEFTASEIKKWVGVPRGRLVVIPNGVGEEWSVEEVGQPAIAGDYLLAVGNVKPHKNLQVLLGLAEAMPEGPPIVVVGKCSGFVTGDDSFVKLASALHPRIRMMGEVDDVTLRNLSRHALAVVFPSLYEGFGLPPLEAMAIGTPVVASRIPAVEEVCGNAVLYARPMEVADYVSAVRQLQRDPELRRELRIRGQQRARQFTWRKSASSTWEVLASAAGWTG